MPAFASGAVNPCRHNPPRQRPQPQAPSAPPAGPPPNRVLASARAAATRYRPSRPNHFRSRPNHPLPRCPPGPQWGPCPKPTARHRQRHPHPSGDPHAGCCGRQEVSPFCASLPSSSPPCSSCRNTSAGRKHLFLPSLPQPSLHRPRHHQPTPRHPRLRRPPSRPSLRRKCRQP